MMTKIRSFAALLTITLLTFSAWASADRWTEQTASQWYSQQGWTVGSNYTPQDAINQLEMWQRETFNPLLIDRELGYAEQMGLTGMRVFLHDLVWQADADGFKARINTFLEIASRHHIRPIFVIFDSCWNPNPHLGPQPAPTPGVHNSGWVQSPGVDAVMDLSQRQRLKDYVQGLVGSFANDRRILAWDVWNEPDNLNGGTSNDPVAKQAAVLDLLPQVFAWAREMNPVQPLTSAMWNGDWSSDATLRPLEKVQLALSDIVSFHNYDPPASFELKINQLGRYNRPIICTEYMARPLGSTIQLNLPIAKNHNVSAFNWGFVAGKTQTFYPWDSWQHPYTAPPAVWFHDLLYPNGTPFDVNEINLIRSLTSR